MPEKFPFLPGLQYLNLFCALRACLKKSRFYKTLETHPSRGFVFTLFRGKSNTSEQRQNWPLQVAPYLLDYYLKPHRTARWFLRVSRPERVYANKAFSRKFIDQALSELFLTSLSIFCSLCSYTMKSAALQRPDKLRTRQAKSNRCLITSHPISIK